MRSLTLTRVLATMVLLASMVVPASAYAAGPVGTLKTVISADFEEGGSTLTSIGPILSQTEETNAYWGPMPGAARSGVRSLWCAGASYPGGAVATSWPLYPVHTKGEAQLRVPQLADYYSSTLSFWYLMPTLGDNDGSAFAFNFWAIDGSGNPAGPDYHTVNPIEIATGWTQLTYDWTNAYGTLISRVPAQFTLRFYQQGAGGPEQSTNAQGPSVDDVTVTGFKYGPVRDLAASNTGTAENPVVHLTWSKPAASTVTSAEDTRAMSYRVWRLDTGAGTWTELTSTSRVNSPTHELTDSGVSAGNSYRYFVQAWDPADGTADWGELAAPVDMVFVADRATATSETFRDYGAGPAALSAGQSVVLQVDVTSHASAAGIPGMVASDFAVTQAGVASMVGATAAAITDFAEDEGVAGRYYLTVSPGVGTTYYRAAYLGKAGGFEASTGSPVLQVNVTGNTLMTTTAKPPVVVSYGGKTTVAGTLSMGGAPLGAEGDNVSLQAWTAAGWSDVAAAIADDGKGGYSAVTPAVTSATSFRLHFAGDGSLTASTDLGKVDVVPYASLTAPSGKSTARYRKYYTVTGTLRPGHSGTPVRIEGYQKVRGKYRRRWTKSATNVNYGSYSKYTFKIKLAKGYWRLYAVHADSSHATTRTRYKAVRCR